jgi:thiol-disulfide isomerase/thioredoxin
MSQAQKRQSRESGKQKDQTKRDIERKEKAYVLFYATWCPFSQEFLPIFEEYSKNNPKECLSVIVDGKPDLCEEFDIEYFPTVILFKKGRIHRRLDAEPGVGLSKKQLKELTEKT